ncbi:MAG TPA: WYL domain-containing protein [Acidimicrobiales bacterium]|jgi:predicted DNA-binding transcriptional regulator YafY|nr:WYL domain-containing protein [Acidimicrobiales bacterium]
MAGPARLDRLERVTDLVLVLLNATQPLTLDSIAHQVPGYPEEHGARRQAFERDKRLLRDDGIPVRTERLPGNEQYGYLIDREAFYLPDLALLPDEQVALHLAVAGVHLGDPSGRDALLKLGATGLGDVRPIASLEPPRALIDLFEAVRIHAEATFAYRSSARRVAPVGLWFRFGHWYLVAWDLDRDAVRTFRVDRIEGSVTLGELDADAVPVDIDIRAALPDEPWQSDGEDQIPLRVRIDAMEGPRVSEEVGADKVERGDDDGSVVLALTVTNFGAIRSWVLGLLEHAEILEPELFREELREWLRTLMAGVVVTVDEAAMWTTSADEEDTDGKPAPGQETSGRLRRLLAVVGWLAQVGEASIAEVAERFAIGAEELVRELELAACCGVPPYTPDTLMEIEVSETTVRAFLPPEFARPRRLTPAEGFAVAASARLILAVPGSDDAALGRALAKLDAALGSREAMGVDVDAPQLLGVVRQAADTGGTLEIDYHSASRDEATTRVIEPVQVITTDGHWYVDAFCQRAGDMRRFRIDRIGAARPVADPASAVPRTLRAADHSFLPGPGAVEVHLRLTPEADWVVESIPVWSVGRSASGQVTDVILNVTGMAWFERLLLQLGPDAQVISPPELTDLAARAAAKVFEMYREDIE